jgi:hypothetical protein
MKSLLDMLWYGFYVVHAFGAKVGNIFGQKNLKVKTLSPGQRVPRTSKERNLTTLLYLISLAVLTAGASYAAVPLYRIFCQVKDKLGLGRAQA